MNLPILIYAAMHGPACLLFNCGVLPFEWLLLLGRPAYYLGEWYGTAEAVRSASVHLFLALAEWLAR